MTRQFTLFAYVLAGAAAGAVALAGCGSPGAPSSARTGRSTGASGGTAPRVPGSPAPDSACARLVSAIGFAELRLEPRGHESEQTFDSATRGQIAYVEGTIVLYGERLPPQIRKDAVALRPTIRTLARAKERRPVRVAALKTFRARAAKLVTACGGKPTG